MIICFCNIFLKKVTLSLRGIRLHKFRPVTELIMLWTKCDSMSNITYKGRNSK